MPENRGYICSCGCGLLLKDIPGFFKGMCYRDHLNKFCPVMEAMHYQLLISVVWIPRARMYIHAKKMGLMRKVIMQSYLIRDIKYIVIKYIGYDSYRIY